MQNSREKFAEHLQKICRNPAENVQKNCRDYAEYVRKKPYLCRVNHELLPKHNRSITEA